MNCFSVINLHKKYGSVHAVKGVSFEVKKGICFGLLGSNGAGKSTIIEILEGIKSPTSGDVLFYKKPRNFQQYKEKIGVQFQSTALQDYMKVKEALHTFSSFYKNPYPVEKIVKMCRLEEILDRDHRHLSGGQRKRLLLGLSLINNPEVLFLDEPTAGLDPVSRKSFWELIQSIKNQNRTIIFTTHFMDEVYELCEEILILHRGNIIAQGTPSRLLYDYFNGIRVSIPLSCKKYLDASFPYPWKEKKEHIEFKIEDLQSFIKELVSRDIPIHQLETHPYTLDDLFMHLSDNNDKNDSDPSF